MGFRVLAGEYAKLSSAHFAFLTAIIPVTGAIAMGEKNLFLLTIIFIIGLLTHVFGFGFNHYNDIEVDKLIKEIAKRPLPSGKIKKEHAAIYLISVVLIGAILTVYFFGFILLVIYLIGILLAGIYDIFSKKIIGMDFILAASVSVGVFFGSATVSFNFTNLAILFWILAFLQTINLNLIAGGLKDADHDMMFGSKHISTRLGVRVENNRFVVPKSFRLIAYLNALIYAFIVLVPIVFGFINLNFILFVILISVNVLFFYVTYKMLNLKHFDRQEIRKYVVYQYNVNWFNIPILLMSVAPWAGLLILYPVGSLVVSNIYLYKTILRPQVM